MNDLNQVQKRWAGIVEGNSWRLESPSPFHGYILTLILNESAGEDVVADEDAVAPPRPEYQFEGDSIQEAVCLALDWIDERYS